MDLFENQNLVEVKKQLWSIYSDITKGIYGNGVVELKINIYSDMIMFLARHNRVPVLAAMEEHYMQLKQNVDYALFQEFKYRLKISLEKDMNIKVLALLKDYDPDYKLAVTIVVAENC